MGVYPTQYSKEEFIEFLQKNHVNELLIEKFKVIPENVKKKSHIYKLNILCTFISVGETSYNFELNYYSEDQLNIYFLLKFLST